MSMTRFKIAWWSCLLLMGSMRLPWRRDRQRGRIARGWRLLSGVSAARGDAVTTSPPLRARALALGGDLVPRSPPEAILFSEVAAYRAFAVAQRRSGPTSRAMRRRCRARRNRIPIRTECGVRTTTVCTVPRCRIRKRRRPKSYCCDDGAICRSISNLIRTSSPAIGRLWPSANVSVASSISTTRPSTSWHTVG